MSHEIRTPLNGIVGMIDLMSSSNEFNLEQQQQIDIIKQSSLVLLSILNDILDLSKLEVGKFQLQTSPTNLNDIILQVQSLFSAQVTSQGIKMTAETDEFLNRKNFY